MNNLNVGLDANKVNPLKLPSLPLGWRKGFPSCPAIYFAIAGKKVLYIGRTAKLFERWKAHHRQAELESIKEVRIAWMEVSDPSLLPAIEKALIQYFKPLLNEQLVKIRPKGKGRGNPNPKQKMKPVYGDEALSSKTVALRLPREIDDFVRSLPNRTEWLRKAIADAYEKETAAINTASTALQKPLED